jgi:hypothetical protein
VGEDTRFPQSHDRADHQDEVADEKEMDEAHMLKNEGLRAKG